MRQDFTRYTSLYKNTLLEDVIPFWEKYSLDHEYGGYFTCLDREGKVFQSDKFIWLQARQVWTFSMLYNRVEKRPSWLEIARLGAEFLKKYGRDEDGNWYFSLLREGKPLVQPYNIFSDCFACMAFAQYGLATQEEESLEIARKTFANILRRRDNPKGKYSKTYPGTRPLINVDLYIILANLMLEVEGVLSPEHIEQTVEESLHTVLHVFWNPERKLMFDNVFPDGSFCDSFEGRQINVGTALEGMGFLMELAQQRGQKDILEKCVDITLYSLDFGWDQQYGGIFYFLDSEGHPSQFLDWDQKLWWVHLEALVTLSKAYLYTQNPTCLEWYQKVHDYTWTHFPDTQYGEWFGYLNREGEILLPLKGSKWKGCYHVPRAMIQCWRIFEGMEGQVKF